MKSLWMFGAVASCVLTMAVAQSSGELAKTPRQRGLVRAEPEPAQVALEIWREQLALADLDQREVAFERCVGAARRDAGLRAALQTWSRDPAAPELAWTARLALRELGANPRGASALNPWGFDFDAGFGGVDPQQWIEEQQRHWDELCGRGPQTSAPDASSSFESFSFEQTDSGVKCKVTRRKDGQDVTEEYSAATLEELLAAHPELRERIGAESRLQLGGPRTLRGFSLNGFGPFEGSDIDPRFGARLASPDEVVRTDVLGVLVQTLTVDESNALGLEPGVGLRIERVEDGTIARSLGLQRNQILIEINHVPIKTRDDITAQIRARPSDGELEVSVVDRWGQKRTRTWKPDAGKQI